MPCGVIERCSRLGSSGPGKIGDRRPGRQRPSVTADQGRRRAGEDHFGRHEATLLRHLDDDVVGSGGVLVAAACRHGRQRGVGRRRNGGRRRGVVVVTTAGGERQQEQRWDEEQQPGSRSLDGSGAVPVPDGFRRQSADGGADPWCRAALRVGRHTRSSPICSVSRRTDVRGPSCGWAPIRTVPPRCADGRPLSAVDGNVAVPPEGARRRRAAVPTAPSEPVASAGRFRGRSLLGPRAEAGAAVRADDVRGVLRHPSDRCDPRPARRARCRRPGRAPCAMQGPACGAGCAVSRQLPVDPIVAAAACERPPGGGVDLAPRRRYPGDPSVAATLLLNFVRLSPGDACSSARATSTPTSVVPASN